MRIDGKTRLVALIGDPVFHSLSPAMQNRAFDSLGLNCRYMAFAVKPGQVGDAIRGLKALGALGANVTVPHKLEAAIEVDELAGEALLARAVNTIVFNGGGKAVGHNTDAPGLINALREAGYDPVGSPAVVFGAGGAARAAVYGLASAGVSWLRIVNRSVSRAAELAAELVGRYPWLPVSAGDFANGSTQEKLRGASLILNATSLGLDGFSSPLEDLALLQPDCVVCDMVYGPQDTPLVAMAKSRGLRVVDGLSVLLHQGMLSFRLWTGVEPPVEEMRKALEEEISRRR